MGEAMYPAFDVAVSGDADAVVLTATGDLDLATAQTLAGEAARQLERSPGTLTIDMQGLAFCDSAGINALVRIRNMCEDKQTTLRVVDPQPHVRTVLQITGVARFLNLAD